MRANNLIIDSQKAHIQYRQNHTRHGGVTLCFMAFTSCNLARCLSFILLLLCRYIICLYIYATLAFTQETGLTNKTVSHIFFTSTFVVVVLFYLSGVAVANIFWSEVCASRCGIFVFSSNMRICVKCHKRIFNFPLRTAIGRHWRECIDNSQIPIACVCPPVAHCAIWQYNFKPRREKK